MYMEIKIQLLYYNNFYSTTTYICKGTRITIRKMESKRTISSWTSSFGGPRRERRR